MLSHSSSTVTVRNVELGSELYFLVNYTKTFTVPNSLKAPHSELRYQCAVRDCRRECSTICPSRHGLTISGSASLSADFPHSYLFSLLWFFTLHIFNPITVLHSSLSSLKFTHVFHAFLLLVLSFSNSYCRQHVCVCFATCVFTFSITLSVSPLYLVLLLHYTHCLNSYGHLRYFQNICKLEPKANCICC